MKQLKNAYTKIVLNHQSMDGWSAYRVGNGNGWKFYRDGKYVGTVTVLTNGLMSIKEAR